MKRPVTRPCGVSRQIMRGKPGSHFSRDDNYAMRNKGPYKPEVMEEILDHPKIQISDWVHDSVLATVKYLVNKYGVVPTFTNPIHANFTAQIHHVDLDFYRQYQLGMDDETEPYSITDRILGHFKNYHPNEPDLYAQ